MATMISYQKERSFDEDWAAMRNVVSRLLNEKNVSHREWQDLFMKVYNIRSWAEDGPTQLRDFLHNEILVDYVKSASQRLPRHFDDFVLLRAYVHEWRRYYRQSLIIPLPFAIIDKDVPFPTSVREDMLQVWRQFVFENYRLDLLDAAMKLVEMERNGMSLDSNLIVAVRESFVELSGLGSEDVNDSEWDFDVSVSGKALYINGFLKRYIKHTFTYYRCRAGKFLDENGVMEYMSYADEKLREEEARAQKYLHLNDGIEMLMKYCVKELVVEFESQILAECPRLIAENNIERLRMLYRLVKRAPNGIDTIVNCIDQFIRQEGISDMGTNAEAITVDPEKYVNQLLSLFKRFTDLCTNGFYEDSRLLTARDKAFRDVVNDTTIFRMETNPKRGRSVSVESKCPELLANFCDLLLRKTQLSKRLSSEEIDKCLENVLLLLKYVENKDVFMRFHKAHLCRRLILDISADQDKEEMTVTRLRESGMPAEHVNKLSRMLQDIELNKDLTKEFKEYGIAWGYGRVPDVVTLKILNAGAWGRGGSDKAHVSLPKELEDAVPLIETFYRSQHSGRRLNWMHNWSNGTMTFEPKNGGKFDLELTTFQMAVLFQWNEGRSDSFSFETLRLASELPDTELSRTLFSLCAYPKMKEQVLLCDVRELQTPKDFNDSTMFRLNENFNLVKNGKIHQRGRVSLIGKLQLAMEPNAAKEHEDIVALRQFRVQEAIVKIMKTRKVMSLGQLQTELVDVLKSMFVPTRQLIKEQIDWLIENKYMERKSDDMNWFTYIT